MWVYNEIFFMSNIFRDAAGIMRYHAAYSAADDTRQIRSVGLLTNSLTANFGPNFCYNREIVQPLVRHIQIFKVWIKLCIAFIRFEQKYNSADERFDID